MKNKFIIAIVTVTAIVVSVAVYYDLKNVPRSDTKEMTEEVSIFDQDDNKDGLPEQSGMILGSDGIVYDENHSGIIFDPSKLYDQEELFSDRKLNSINEVTKEYVDDYLYPITLDLQPRNYNGFSDFEIGRAIAALTLVSTPTKFERVKELAKRYFGKENYILPIREYGKQNFLPFYVGRKDGYYFANVEGSGYYGPHFILQSVSIKGNTVLANYNYQTEDNELLGTEFEVFGTAKIEMTYHDGSLVVNQIEYINF